MVYDICDLCNAYENETNSTLKQKLKSEIIKFCDANQDASIPPTASKLYLEYLLR